MRLNQNARPGAGARPIATTQTHQLRLGVALPRLRDTGGAAEVTAVTRLAEALGFDTAWVLDQGGNGAAGAFNLIAHLAGQTTSIGFGTWLPQAGQSGELLEQIQCTHRMTGGRLSLAVTYPAGYYDESLAYQVPGRLVEVMRPSSRHVVPGGAFLASCQVTYQDIEGERPRFTGSFAQITADIRAMESAGAGEVILDFTGSASVRVASDYAFHLGSLREAVQPGRRFTREDPFDFVT